MLFLKPEEIVKFLAICNSGRRHWQEQDRFVYAGYNKYSLVWRLRFLRGDSPKTSCILVFSYSKSVINFLSGISRLILLAGPHRTYKWHGEDPKEAYAAWKLN